MSIQLFALSPFVGTPRASARSRTQVKRGGSLAEDSGKVQQVSKLSGEK